MDTSSDCLLVISNLPDLTSAQRLAEHLVGNGLAACVNIHGPCQSIYRWEGKVEKTGEMPVFIKTTAARYAALEAAIRELHPYEVPEIIAVPVTHGLPAYLQWVHGETEPPCAVC